MMCARDFREVARNALFGRWKMAALTAALAVFIGATVGEVDFSDELSSKVISDIRSPEAVTSLVILLVVVLVWGLFLLVIGGAGTLGYAAFNLKLVSDEEAAVSDLFSQFHRIWDGICLRFLLTLYTLLWTLLFIIPGIVKGFSYAMTDYIMVENPGSTVNEAITESRRLMNGNKFRLFCLGFSFIGWDILCWLPVGIGTSTLEEGGVWIILFLLGAVLSFVGQMFLLAYKHAAYAAFYREITAEAAWAAQRTETAAW